MEGDCNMAYGLLSIALCHQGMKGGRDEEERAIWREPVGLVELEYS